MSELKKIEDVAFWKTKCNIILAQYYLKETPCMGRRMKNQYKSNIKFLSSAPKDKDLIIDFLLEEGLLKKNIIEDREVVQITPNGLYAIKESLIESDTENAYNRVLISLTLIVTICTFALTAMDIIFRNRPL